MCCSISRGALFVGAVCMTVLSRLAFENLIFRVSTAGVVSCFLLKKWKKYLGFWSASPAGMDLANLNGRCSTCHGNLVLRHMVFILVDSVGRNTLASRVSLNLDGDKNTSFSIHGGSRYSRSHELPFFDSRNCAALYA